MKIQVETYYGMTCWKRLELPENKTWDDIEAWHIRREMLYAEFKDGSRHQYDLSDCDATQYPVDVEIREVHKDDVDLEEEEVDEGEPLAVYHARVLDDVEMWRKQNGKPIKRSGWIRHKETTE
jgi:hypothetical protein